MPANFLSAKEAIQAIRAGELTSQELVKDCLDRIVEHKIQYVLREFVGTAKRGLANEETGLSHRSALRSPSRDPELIRRWDEKAGPPRAVASLCNAIEQ